MVKTASWMSFFLCNSLQNNNNILLVTIILFLAFSRIIIEFYFTSRSSSKCAFACDQSGILFLWWLNSSRNKNDFSIVTEKKKMSIICSDAWKLISVYTLSRSSDIRKHFAGFFIWTDWLPASGQNCNVLIVEGYIYIAHQRRAVSHADELCKKKGYYYTNDAVTEWYISSVAWYIRERFFFCLHPYSTLSACSLPTENSVNTDRSKCWAVLPFLIPTIASTARVLSSLGSDGFKKTKQKQKNNGRCGGEAAAKKKQLGNKRGTASESCKKIAVKYSPLHALYRVFAPSIHSANWYKTFCSVLYMSI